MSCVVGIRPYAGGFTIDPYPFGIERAELTGAHVRGHRVDVRIIGERVGVMVDDRSFETVIGMPLEVAD